jgi:tripartite-type tricarboxylate transporter receptor subunit TctC
MSMSQRVVVAILLALSAPTLAQAQGSWPDRPIKFIVHVAAGGGVDMNARILVDRLNQQLRQPVLIEDQGGGGGVIAARAVAKAAADGYTFLFAGPGHAAQAFMHKQPPFDPITDFIPVALVT